jgi:hypothetical protein
MEEPQVSRHRSTLYGIYDGLSKFELVVIRAAVELLMTLLHICPNRWVYSARCTDVGLP